MRKWLILFLFIPCFLFAQNTILHLEIRDYNNDEGCAGNNDGWTWYYYWNDFSLARADSFLHCNNDGYDDTGQSAIVGKMKYEVTCACNDDNPINMFVRNYYTNTLLDSLIIYSNQTGHETHRLTLLGICKWTGKDTLLLGGYERYNHPPAITHADTMYGIWKWVPGETTAYWCYDTETSGSYAMNGLAMNGSLLYCVSENTDTLEVINTSTWTQSAVKDMGQPGGVFRGLAIIDTTIIVGNATDNTLDYYGITALAAFGTPRDMSATVRSGNILYGIWTKKISMRSPVILK